MRDESSGLAGRQVRFYDPDSQSTYAKEEAHGKGIQGDGGAQRQRARLRGALRRARRLHGRLRGVQQGGDMAPLFRGLPDDRCQSPHWGIVVKGRLTFTYADGEDVIEAGEAYYAPPGHTPA